jgi:hypothetical protein
MTEENKEVVVTPEEVTKVESAEPEKTVEVDIFGVNVALPLSKAKELIAKRDSTKNELTKQTTDNTELKARIAKAEVQARQESDRANLLQAMKASDIESVKSQVSQEYLSKIAAYENKIFNGEIKSQLATLGVLPDALQDACTLALQGTKVTLDGDTVKVNDKDSKEFLTEWVKTKAHLVAVKAPEGKTKVTVRGGKPPEQKPSGAERLNKGLQSFLKP